MHTSSLLVLVIAGVVSGQSEFLRVQGTNFMYGTQRVFLSGVNYAWYEYCQDFGNNRYNTTTGATLEDWLTKISAAGGNSIRVWVGCEGYDDWQTSPIFDDEGLVVAPDRAGTFIDDMARFLDVAQENNIFVFPTLWNAAVKVEGKYRELLRNETKLQSYIDAFLLPLVKALKDKPALGGYDLMNEPEGSILVEPEPNTNKCQDTSILVGTGAGWTDSQIPIQEFQAFFNKISAAIKAEDPKALTTVGSGEAEQSDAFGNTFGYWSNACLLGAGMIPTGHLDFQQVHSYSWEGRWGTYSPFKLTFNQYQLMKPLVIGEFSADCAEGEGVDYLWDYAYSAGYGGAWSWQYNEGGNCADSQATQNQGMTRIKEYDQNGVIPIDIA